jgi:hypothetical protein
MQEFSDATDLPPVIVVERRHLPDRRGFWRGGRRNTDWMRRPIGAWRHLEQSLSPWRQWFTKRPQPVMRAAGGQHEARP